MAERGRAWQSRAEQGRAGQTLTIDVEEDAQFGDHLEEPLLDDAHLILARAPYMAEERVKVLWLQRWHRDRLAALLVAQPACL